MGTLNVMAAQVARALRPLAFATHSEDRIRRLIADLGWMLPTVPPSLSGLGDNLAQLHTSIANLGSSDKDVALRDVALQLALVVNDLHELGGRLRAELPAEFIAATHIDEELEGRIFDWLLSMHLAKTSPVLYRVLRVAGVIEVNDDQVEPDFFNPVFGQHRIHWRRLFQLQDPASLARDVYGWGTPSIDAARLFRELVPLSFGLGMPAEFHYASSEATQKTAPGSDTQGDLIPQLWIPIIRSDVMTFFIVIGPLAKANPNELQGLVLVLVSSADGDLSVPIGDELELVIHADAQVGTGAALILRPDRPPDIVLDVEGVTGAELTSGRITVELVRRAADWEKSQGLSADGGTGITARNVSLKVGAEAAGGDFDIFAEFKFDEVKLVVAAPEGDGLLARLLPEDGVTAEFSLAVRWSREGLHLEGSAGLAVRIPLNVTVGPLLLQSLNFGIKGDGGNVAVDAGLTAAFELGPVLLTVENMGLTAAARAMAGNLGPVDFDIGFKPPTGVGLSIDTSGISGGGFLRIDPPNYVGMLALTFQKEIELTAFGLITTRLPDGKPGFSLVISILAEFQPIQIGLGFALNGVGGLIGINRQFNEEGLKAAFKTHALDDVLFPANPIKDAVKLFDTLQSILPPREGYHVIGPMARLFWGGALRLVNFEIGIFIQLGGPLKIVLMGQAWSRLPREEAALLVLNVDVLGVIDFGEERVAFDATLFDSHLMGIHLDGQMALRADWSQGEENFALSVGGFHPQFQQIPAGFPQLRRLAMVMGENPRLSLTMYLAITTNTLQVGAKLELWAKKLGFTITGGASFDALFTFSPFSFLVNLKVWVNVKRGWIDLGLYLELQLTGPNPVVAAGYVKIKLGWFFSVKVRFRAEFGKKIAEPLPAVSPLAVLKGELQQARAIRAQLPSWASGYVAFTAAAENKIDPLADLQIVQNAVPLNFTMDKFGGGLPVAAERRLRFTAGLTSEQAVTRLFAGEQFKNWTVEERLAAKPFEQHEAGIGFSGSYALPEGQKEEREIVFETVLRESKEYLESLPAKDVRKVAVRTACVWQPQSAQTVLLQNWSQFGTATYYQPRRVQLDAANPNYVKVLDIHPSLEFSTR